MLFNQNLIDNLSKTTLPKMGRVRGVILLLTFLFQLSASSLAQSVEWEKTYGWEKGDEIYTITKVENSYYAAGNTGVGNTLNKAPITLVKLNSKGDTIFVKPNFNHEGIVVDLTPSADNNIFALAAKWNPSTFTFDRTLVAKIDTNGNHIWARDYNIGGFDEDVIVALADGGAIFMGSTGLEPYATRIDSVGNEVWNNVFPQVGNHFPRHLFQLRNGRFMMSGYQHLGTRKNMFYLIIDENGNQIAIDTITTGLQDGDYGGAAIAEAMNGDYLITTRHWGNDSTYLFRMDSNFNYKWHIARERGLFFEPYEMLDGNVVVGGVVDNSFGSFIKTSPNGTALSELNIFNTIDTTPVDFTCIAYDNLGSAIFGGTTRYNTDNVEDFYFAKVDSIGIPVTPNFNCNPPQIHWIDTEIQTLNQVQLTDSSSENVLYSDLMGRKWHFEDGTILYGDTVVKTLANACPDSMWAMLVVSDGIGCTDTLTVDICSGAVIPNPIYPIPPVIGGIAEGNSSMPLNIYPNPFNETFTIELPTDRHSLRNAVEIRNLIYLTNLLGEQQAFTYELTNDKMVIHTGNLPKGIYVLNMEGVGRSKVVKR